MKYGTNPTPLDQAENSLLQAMEQQAQTPWYLWIDFAFDVADDTPAPLGDVGVNVYQVPELSELQHLGPRIVPVFAPGDSTAQVRQRLRPWLAHASGRPMLSAWASAHSAQALAQHVLAWSKAQTPEKDHVLLRLADTRSACTLQQTLSSAQWHGLTQPLQSWLYLDRHGEVKPLPVGPDPAAAGGAAAQPPVVLDEAQVQAMALAAEPDGLLHYLATHMPELIPQGVRPSQMLVNAAFIVKKSQQYGIEYVSDKLSLFQAACLSLGTIWNDVRLEKLLEYKNYTPGQLRHALVEQGLLG